MSKLTLSVDPNVTLRAKQYAESPGVSVSHLVEVYLDLLSKPAAVPDDAPILKSLRGSLKHGDVPEYRKYLEKKYK